MATISSPPSSTAPRTSAWTHIKREALKWSRTLHIYLSLSAFAMFLFFAYTGVMLTHESFGMDERIQSEKTGTIPTGIASGSDEQAIAEATRKAFNITLPVTQFFADDASIEVTYSGPANRVQVFIQRSDGSAQANFETRGVTGMLNDLHRGAETGTAWRLLLDVSSVWIGLSSITGIIMLLALPKRRRLGLIITVLGTLITLAAYAIYVPR